MKFRLTIVIVVIFVNFSFVLGENMYDLKIVPEACKNLKPIESNYTVKGRYWNLDDIQIYETSNSTSKKILIAVYDIFGFHPNTQQVADKIADGGFRIIMPDFFRGSPWDISNFPPADRNEISKFLNVNGSWSNVKGDIQKIVQHYSETEGIREFGIFGFCWGGRIAYSSAIEIPEIIVSTLIHPASVNITDAQNVNSSMFLMPSKDEADMIPYFNILKSKLGESNVKHHRFEDMFHGFAGARGNFNDELNRKRVNEVIYLLTEFVDEQFKKNSASKISTSIQVVFSLAFYSNTFSFKLRT